MGNVEIPKWLKGLPLAPEFRPTDTEFADPIAYISKIEKEASAFGICKIIPPLPKPSKRYVFSNLNKSLLKCPELGDVRLLSPKVGSGDSAADGDAAADGDGATDGDGRAVFTTRHQELGQSVKRAKGVVKENPQLGVHKQVWQSGEIYTLEQFESKSKAFARSLLGMIKEVNPLVIEALFWKAASEKPIYVEYANDVPGSGFGEPEGQFQYFRRQRRKRASYQSYRRRRGNHDFRNNEIDDVKNSNNDGVKDASIKNEPSICLETASRSSSTTFTEDSLKSSKPKSTTASNDMEGTAGWKLSNSPWNLQVIARSPGSLTRFMPDDIPGVTSPMVYIGMLFSWFAWHVEDHELHSMNFLHTGSPKTWYAVPGDYAFAFEEVICTEAYGGNYDRLAALMLLGEKTTILSPEVILSSGIPCCRLVQNPGEFVVTFPRAYHVGFSHGFNCGEAANFGTPQWLNVAKEAAVRRAAMNYLPMLSHQQLLYLLTMSFVSRVPRSLLPGARSSRLRDRQREERELSVKKAFIEDLLKENDVLSDFLAKESTCPVVIWSPDLLPCASKDTQLPSITSTPKESASHIHSDSNSNNSESDLLKEMSLYMETLNDLYMEDDDLSSDFQVDSGTLVCVACGILGFPFMSVVQPSERASIECMPGNHLLAQGEPEVTRTDNEQTSSEPDSTAKGSISDDHAVQDLSLSLKDLPMPTGWNTSTKFLRPRVFCLEHGVQIEELLQSKGGANMLIICHSDFQKMKSQAAAIAEEIGSPFNYNEVPVESASQEFLNLINLAIDDEDHHECGEDWTSRLGINLQHCVRISKNSPSEQIQHALALQGLFSYKSPSSDFLNIKWQSRRSRSRIKLNQPAHCKPCKISVTNKNEVLGNKSDDAIVKKGKLIRYTRRNYRVKIDYSTNGLQGCSRKPLTEVSEHVGNDPDKHTEETSLIYPCNVENAGSESTGLDFSLILDSDMLHEVQVLQATGDLTMDCASLQAEGPLFTAAVAVESGLGQSENQFLEESSTRGDIPDVKASSSSHEINATEGTNENEDSYATKCCSTFIIAANERYEMWREDQTVGNVNNVNETCNMVSEGQRMVLGDRDISMNEVSDLGNPESSNICCTPLGQMENVVEKSCINKELHGLLTLDDEAQQEFETTSRSIGYQPSSCNATLINLPTASMEERCDREQETCAAEDKTQLEMEITDRSHQEELILSNVRSINQPTLVPVDGSTENHREPHAAVNLYNEVALKNGEQQAFQVTKENNKELNLCSVIQMEIDQTTASSELSNLCSASTLDTVVWLETPADISTVDRVAPNSVTKKQDCLLPVSVEGFSEAPKEICATDALSACVNLEPEVQLALHSSERVGGDVEVQKMQLGTINEEPVSTHVSLSNQPTPYPIQNYSVIEDESVVRRNMQKCNDVCSQEIESIESTTVDSGSTAGKSRKIKKEVVQLTENKSNCNSFIRSPCEGLRPRAGKDVTRVSEVNVGKSVEDNPVRKRARKQDVSVPLPKRREITMKPHKCGLEGCHMRFETKAELQLHKRNRCTYDGCGKKFSSHKYAIIHQRVHEDDRPLKCPWKGCSMSFKWAWARTEHIRVHTGEKPYQCKVEGCGLSFRFVSDFSRHRRKTGHFVDTPA